MTDTMATDVDEIADGIYRLSTYVPDIAPPAGFAFNQFLVDAEQPLLFHTGPRAMFPLVTEAVAKVVRPERVRWISFGHLESDESGSMNDWLALAPEAQVAFNGIGCMVSLNDLADRPPRAVEPDEVLDLGGKRVRIIATPHVPHAWEAQVLFEETTGTLLCGDLFTHVGRNGALTDGDIVGPAWATEDLFGSSSLSAATGGTVRSLARLEPRTLGLMHGSSFNGDCRQALLDLGAEYDRRALEVIESGRAAHPGAPGCPSL